MIDMSSIIPSAAIYDLKMFAATVPNGCFVEVGVYRGGSARVLYEITEEQDRTLHLFDTFKGMPFSSTIDTHQAGEFSDIPFDAMCEAMPNAVFHIGVFPFTLPTELADIAFAHVDCDQYISISSCIEYLWPRMVPGGIMWFDDYTNLAGAYKAISEVFSELELWTAPSGRRYVVK